MSRNEKGKVFQKKIIQLLTFLKMEFLSNFATSNKMRENYKI